jgi:transcriptional regulator with XRE-family HTH domain
MDLPRVVGRNVRELRLRKGMSQEDLAEATGAKRTYVSDLERGQRNPTLKSLDRFAAVLGVEAWKLLRP